MKKTLSIALAALIAVSSLGMTACNKTEAPGKNDDPSKTETKLDPVKLEWYLCMSPQKDFEAVMTEFNKITKEKINAEVNINVMDFSNYGQQMQMKLSSNAVIDLMYTSNWANDFYTDVAKGAYQELDYAQIEKLAPNVIKGVIPSAWDAAKVGGKLYAIPNTQVQARWPAIMTKTEYLKKYNVDPASLKTLKDFTPYFEQIAKNEKGKYAIDVHKGVDVLGFYISKLGYEYFGNTNPLAVKIGDAGLKVVNLYDTPEMKDFLLTLQEWYKKGIIRKDAATVTDTAGETANGVYGSIFAVNNPDTLVNQARLWKVQPEDLTMIPLSEPFLATGSIVATMTAIGQASKNTDRSLMLYNMMYDEVDTRLINLLSFGIEGTHYTKKGDDLIELKQDSGYYVDSGWEYGSLFNCFRTNPTQPAWRPTGPDINSNAVVSDMLGFSMDPAKIKSELAQIGAVMGELTPALMTGSASDVSKAIEELDAKLAKAGLDKVQKEIQAQLDAWKSAK